MTIACRVTTHGAFIVGAMVFVSAAAAQPGVTCNLYGPTHTCDPYLLYPPGQDLRLTVQSRTAGEQGARNDGESLNTLRQLFAALRACWTPPPIEEARPGMEISVRLSFDRTGNILGEPRFTYVTRPTSQDERNLYRRAVSDSLNRCTPLPLTAGLGGAIAGRPIAIRFIDDRKIRGA